MPKTMPVTKIEVGFNKQLINTLTRICEYESLPGETKQDTIERVIRVAFTDYHRTHPKTHKRKYHLQSEAEILRKFKKAKVPNYGYNF